MRRPPETSFRGGTVFRARRLEEGGISLHQGEDLAEGLAELVHVLLEDHDPVFHRLTIRGATLLRDHEIVLPPAVLLHVEEVDAMAREDPCAVDSLLHGSPPSLNRFTTTPAPATRVPS